MKVKDPVCGMEIDTKDAAGTTEYQGQTYYFCSPNCKNAFDKKVTRREEARKMKTKDPVCGMEIDTKDAVDKSEYQGQTYYFCSPHCKKAFDKEPEKYVSPNHQHGEHH